jgi:cell division septum initiation protein DivIVA
MTFDCKDLERALAIPELLPDAREHAKVCDVCRRELWLWGEMSAVAPSLREDWETPDLWPKIRQTLAAQQKAAKRHSFTRRFEWRMLAGIAAALAIAVSVFMVKYSRPAPAPAAQQDSDFLTEQTLKEVEQTEAAYRASIDKLSRLVQPKLNASENPVAIAAREKLMVLDSEIVNVRSTVARNKFNAQLQADLAVLYRDKQDTLKEILQHAQSSQ